jgi:CRISPR-associated endonuclease/helicase Cas3
MVSDLNRKCEFEDFHSHPDKKLTVHTEGVTRRVVARTALRIARIASLFHDVGKVNPNFQIKVDPRLAGKGSVLPGYSSHAYLSALTFLSFPKHKWKSVLGLHTGLEVFSIVALAARHHGNLRNFATADKKSDKVSAEVDIDLRSILSEAEYFRACEHISHCTNMSLADFAAYLLKTDFSFEVRPCAHDKLPFMSLEMKDALDFFMDTQFAFSCLIESDKRDAGNNAD